MIDMKFTGCNSLKPLKPTSISLNQINTIGFVMSPRLGDSLLAMIIVNNLQRNGYRVTVFSDYLYALQRWFPGTSIKPYPTDLNSAKQELQVFDLLLHTYPTDVLYHAETWHQNLVILDNFPLYRRCISMVDLQVLVCQELLGLTQVVRANGLNSPPELKFQNNPLRVVIHPTASQPIRCWLPKRFAALADQLKFENYEPVFVVAPHEKKQILELVEDKYMVYDNFSLDHLAEYLYESGWFIGSDSGIGHLASNLGIPTVSLMQRRKVMLRWRPDWAPGETVLCQFPLILRIWKEKYWKYLISTQKVLKAFKRLTHRKDTNLF